MSEPESTAIQPCESLEEAEVLARHHARLNPWVKTLLAEYDRRGEKMKTFELGMLAGLVHGLDKETADRVGDRMREIVGLGPDREPLTQAPEATTEGPPMRWLRDGCPDCGARVREIRNLRGTRSIETVPCGHMFLPASGGDWSRA